MKRLLITIPFIMGWGVSNEYTAVSIHELSTIDITPISVEVVEPTLVVEYETQDLTPLIDAMIWVESRGNDSAYCEVEEAVGCLQIRPIMLRECNRILKLKKLDNQYELNDRWNREKSIEIFIVVANHHHRNGTYEEIARAWNGGPNWAEKSGTKRYWRKVQRKLKEQSKENEHRNNRLPKI